MTDSETVQDAILKALRRITRSIDLHSRELASTFGLTGPQLVCLRVVGHNDEITPSKLAEEVSLSQATITGIIDRLAARQLVTRDRSLEDRRLITVKVTAAGAELIKIAPYPLQESFIQRFSEETPEEQVNIRRTLEKIVRMMNSEGLKAAPVLSTSPAALTAEEIEESPEEEGADTIPLDAEPGQTPAIAEAPLEPPEA